MKQKKNNNDRESNTRKMNAVPGEPDHTEHQQQREGPEGSELKHEGAWTPTPI